MRILFPILAGMLILNGCGNNRNALPNDPTVRIVAVLHRPSARLSWANERDMLQLTPQEKEEITKTGMTGELEVVYTANCGSGSPEVRVVIIQTAPIAIQSPAKFPVPAAGSVVYAEERGVLKPLVTNAAPSSLVLEIKQEKNQTMFYMDYPRDMTRYGGVVFWWDEKGKWHEL